MRAAGLESTAGVGRSAVGGVALWRALAPRLRDAWPAAAVAVVALLFLPNAGSSFEAPKLVALGGLAVAALVSGFRVRAPAHSLVAPALFAAALVASLASDVAKPAAVARELGVGVVVVGLTLRRLRVETLAGPLAAAGTAIAVLTLAQALGLGHFGAEAPGRLALFGTLGNPDFVAAFLAPVLALLVPWLAGPRVGRWALGAFLVIAGALAATRSLATLLSLSAAAVVFVAGCSWRVRVALGSRSGVPTDRADRVDRNFEPVQPERSRRPTLPAIPIAWRTVLDSARTERVSRPNLGRPCEPVEALHRVWWSPSTSPGRTVVATRVGIALGLALLLCAALAWGRDWHRALDGRAYLWRVAAAKVLVHPLTGFGPGAVEALWPEWEAAAWRAGAFAASDVRFVDAQDHLHQDLLERTVEQGALGLVALLATAGLALWRLVRARSPHALAAAAALAALLARTLVDFPLARPAEAALFALLVAAGLSSSQPLKEPT